MVQLQRDVRRGDGRAGEPVLLQMKLTNRCNMRCKMCGQWGETGFHKEGIGRQSLDPALALRLLDDAAASGSAMTLWGGEPLLYPQLERVMMRAAELEVPLSLITNGLVLSRHADLIIRSGLKDLFVSIDGTAEIHDRMRGLPGAYERVVQGMQDVQRAREAAGRSVPKLHILTTITEDNYLALEELYDALADMDLEIASVSSSLRWWTDEETGRAYQAFMTSQLGVEEASSWRGFACGPPPIDTDQLAAVLARARKKRRPFKMVFHPRIKPQELGPFFTDLSQTFGRGICHAPWTYALLLPDGELTFCPDFPDYSIGNLAQARVPELWNGARAIAFRKLMLQRLLPICSRCCGLYMTGGRRKN